MQILTNYDVTGTQTAPLQATSFSSHVWHQWFWQITMPAGSGTNQCAITASAVANPEDTSATAIFVALEDSRRWVGPYIVTDAQVTAGAGGGAGGTYLATFTVPNLWPWISLTFVRSGGGTRTFRFNVWVNTP